MTSISTADTSINHEKYENIILKNPPSLFMIKVLFVKIFKEKEIKKNVEINDFEELGLQLPIEVETDPEQIIELTAKTPLFGMNQNIDNTLTIFQQITYELLDFKKINKELIYKTNFKAETIK
ncbi:hypothetical protein C1646_759287 [Rhizophagus diaphanus]|nr:hypothetical protein C1646_759287 [Rhizophagus diaphanus] [Rhizophagus sp. MUCL 43196]